MSILNTMEIKLPKAVCEAINLLNKIEKDGYIETAINLDGGYVEINEEGWEFLPLPKKLEKEMDAFSAVNSREYFELNAWHIFPEMWQYIKKIHKNGRSRKLIEGEENNYHMAVTEFIASNAIKYWFKN